MVDQKITALTELAATPDDNDILVIVDDPAGTPITKKIKFSNISSVVYADKLNLVIAMNAVNPTYQVDIDFDCLTCFNTSFEAKSLISGNLTVDISASGVNGLDTGAEASSTWYYLWVIGKTDGTIASLLSVSTTISTITLPVGYTYGRLIGAIYNDGSSNFIPGTWDDGWFWYDDPVSAYTSSADDKPTAYTDLDCSGEVPSFSNIIDFYSYTTGASVAFNFIMRRNGSASNPSGYFHRLPDSSLTVVNCDNSQIVEWKVTATNAQILTHYVRGYKNIE